MRKQPSKGFFQNSVRGNFEEFTRNHCRNLFFYKVINSVICYFIKNKSLTQVLSPEFWEICKNTYFTEHHRTAASYYSIINGNEDRIGKWNCKLWHKNKAYVPIWARSVSYQKSAALVKFEQLSEAVVHRFSSKWVFLKFSQIPKENACVGDTFLKSCSPEGC